MRRTSSIAYKLGQTNTWAAHADWVFVLVLGAIGFSFDKSDARVAFVNKAFLHKYAYPLTPGSVPPWTVPIYAILGPLAIMVPLVRSQLVSIPRALAAPFVRNVYLIQLAKSLLTATLLAVAITNCIKLPVGRLRPSFLTRCWPDGVQAWEQKGLSDYGGYVKCTGDPGVVNEGRKSFPSGHSSFSASGLGYLTFWLIWALKPFTPGGRPDTWRLVVSLLPILGAVAVAITRVIEYWHHWEDVVAGLTLGTTCAYLAFRQLHGPLLPAVPEAAQVAGSWPGGMAGVDEADAEERLLDV